MDIKYTVKETYLMILVYSDISYIYIYIYI